MCRYLTVVRFLLLTVLVIATGPRATAAAGGAHEEWLRSFYLTRNLGPFDAYWTDVMVGGVLADPGQVEPTLGFVSQLLRQNPALVRTHLVELGAYPPAQREAMARLFWLSDTDAARERLRKDGRIRLAALPLVGIAQHPIREATDLDFCWGWFFATGDVDALGPIIAALDLAPFAGARERYASSGRTAQDRFAARNDGIHDAAVRSLTANIGADPFIARYVETILRDPRTPATRAAALAEILRAAMTKS